MVGCANHVESVDHSIGRSHFGFNYFVLLLTSLRFNKQTLRTPHGRCQGTDHLAANCPLRPPQQEEKGKGEDMKKEKGSKDRNGAGADKPAKKRKAAEDGHGSDGDSSEDDERSTTSSGGSSSSSDGDDNDDGPAAPSAGRNQARSKPPPAAAAAAAWVGGGDDLGDDDFLLEDADADDAPQERGEQRQWGQGRGQWKSSSGKKGGKRPNQVDRKQAEAESRPVPAKKKPKTKTVVF